MALELRRLGAEALDLLAALHGRCFAEPWDRIAFGKLLAQPQTWALAAVADGVPVGFALLRAAADQGEILSLGVLPEARRRGAGRFLVDGALAALAARGAVIVFLEVADDNAPALALYTACGFAACGRRPAYYRLPVGETVDALVLRRAVKTVQGGSPSAM